MPKNPIAFIKNSKMLWIVSPVNTYLNNATISKTIPPNITPKMIDTFFPVLLIMRIIKYNRQQNVT